MQRLRELANAAFGVGDDDAATTLEAEAEWRERGKERPMKVGIVIEAGPYAGNLIELFDKADDWSLTVIASEDADGADVDLGERDWDAAVVVFGPVVHRPDGSAAIHSVGVRWER